MVTFYIRLQLGIRLRYKSKSNIYSELIVVNVAEGWSERLRSYLGRSKDRLSEVSQAITERQAKREKSGGCFRLGKAGRPDHGIPRGRLIQPCGVCRGVQQGGHSLHFQEQDEDNGIRI